MRQLFVAGWQGARFDETKFKALWGKLSEVDRLQWCLVQNFDESFWKLPHLFIDFSSSSLQMVEAAFKAKAALWPDAPIRLLSKHPSLPVSCSHNADAYDLLKVNPVANPLVEWANEDERAYMFQALIDDNQLVSCGVVVDSMTSPEVLRGTLPVGWYRTTSWKKRASSSPPPFLQAYRSIANQLGWCMFHVSLDSHHVNDWWVLFVSNEHATIVQELMASLDRNVIRYFMFRVSVDGLSLHHLRMDEIVPGWYTNRQ
jgi:hypothetical protein